MIITFDTLDKDWFSGVIIDSSHATGDLIPCISNFSEYRNFERYEIYGSLLMFGRILEGSLEYGVLQVRSIPDYSMLKVAISDVSEIVTDEYTLNEALNRTDHSYIYGQYTLGKAISLCSEELEITPNLTVSSEPLRNYSEVDRNKLNPNDYGYFDCVTSFTEREDDSGYYHTREFLSRGLIHSSVSLVLCLYPLFRMRIKKKITKNNC